MKNKKTKSKILAASLSACLLCGAVAVAGLHTVGASATGLKADILTDDEVAALWTAEEYRTMVTEGGTIGSANGDKITGSFKATSANGIVAGGATVDKEAGDFSVVIMGDQQTAVEYHSAYVAASYNWIVQNKDAMNLKMYVNLGDIVDDVDFLPWVSRGVNGAVAFDKGRQGNWKMQLEFASNQAKKLLNAEIPTALVLGNHDYQDMANNYRIKDNFNEYFPLSDYSGYDWFGESLYDDVEAATYFFTGADADDQYMVITLGCYPTDDMLAWANEKVAENPDKKVIVALHAYTDANSDGGDIFDYSRHAWDTFISQHENIFLVVNGHECTDDGSVWRRVDYGVNGNPVTQLMINPQKEEFGGAGIFSQLIFRADGTVDFVYYSPYVAEHNGTGYFMDENQFTFTLEPEKLVAPAGEENAPTTVGNAIEKTSATFSYLGRETEEVWLSEVWDYYNVTPTLSGLQAKSGAGYVTHRLYAGEYKRFSTLSLEAFGEFGSANGVYQIDLSADGENWTTAYYNNAETGYFDRPIDVSGIAAGAEYLYVRLFVQDAAVAKLNVTGGAVQTVFTGQTFMQTHDFTAYTDAANGLAGYTDWDMQGAYAKSLAVLGKDVNGTPILGSGGSGRLTYKSSVTYRFDGGEKNRTLQALTVDYTMTATDPMLALQGTAYANGYEFDDPDADFVVRVLVSTDGKTWQAVKTDLSSAVDYGTGGVTTHWSQAVLNDYVEDSESVLVKLEYLGFGAGRASVGFRQIRFSGEYDNEIVTEEDTEPVIEYVLNGGYFEGEAGETPVREGYEFKGWYLNENFEGHNVLVKDVTEDCTLYAKWERTYFRVVWMLDGGANDERNPEYISDGEYYAVIYDATKEGYTFLGWFDGNGKEITELRAVESDIIVFAKWQTQGGESETPVDPPAEDNPPETPSAPEQNKQTKEDDGCGSSLTVVPVAFVLGGVALLLKKKKSEE
ncbi:MAG: InlB B-repeat-containing protein [Clostridia bacterium]|nr:InlB B-repeat-containing protein [Clostridia bacterium]